MDRTKPPRALFFSPFFYPEKISTGRYNASLVEALRDAGFDVTVVCSHPLYPAWRPQPTTEKVDRVNIIRGGAYLKYPRSPVLRRLLLEAWYACFATIASIRHRRNTDIVIAVFPPSLFFWPVSAVLPAAARRVGIIHDLQGVHAKSKGRGGVVSILSSAIGYVERRSFSACHSLIALSDSMRSEMCALGFDGRRIAVRYPFANLPRLCAGADKLAPLFPRARGHVVYAGALGEKQNPIGLAAILAASAERMSDVMFHVFSEGPAMTVLRDRLGQHKNVALHKLVAEKDLAELYHRADVQLIPQAAGTGAGSMPSKLPNILASNRPVLVICDHESELGQIVKRFSAGEVCCTWDAHSVAEAIDRLLKSRADQAFSNDRKAVLEEFGLDKLVNTIVEDVGIPKR